MVTWMEALLNTCLSFSNVLALELGQRAYLTGFLP